MGKRGWLNFAVLMFAVLVVAIGTSRWPDSLPDEHSPLEPVEIADRQRPVVVDEQLESSVLEASDNMPSSEVAEILQKGLPTPECEETAAENDQYRSYDLLMSALKQSRERISGSDDPDLLFAEAMIGVEGEVSRRIELLEKALLRSPRDKVMAWHHLVHCEAPGCDREASVARAIEVDPMNAAVWVEASRDAIRAGDWQVAEDLLRRAAAAGSYSIYFIEHAMVLERAFAATTDLSYIERVLTGIGYSAAIAIPSYSDLVGACRSESNDPQIWGPICADLGRVMEQAATDAISVSIGLGIQQDAAEKLADTIELEVIEERQQRLRDNTMTERALAGAEALAMNDPKYLRSYIEHYATHGELSAIEFAAAEAKRLRADPTYDQFNFVIKPRAEH